MVGSHSAIVPLNKFSDLHNITISQVVREFKCPDGLTDREVDAAGDGDVLVILDLRLDESLLEAGVAREKFFAHHDLFITF
ncbi:hypothetical protein NC651_016854 [Populus alba x Populus x berolinensis]|nr:hypothetical protein NC651_016854 [Populus alba x Populus x berolinensis]